MEQCRNFLLCGDGFMDFIHRPKGKILKNIKKLKSQRFGSCLCFPPQVNGGGEEKNTYTVGPLRQSWRPSLPLHSPEDGSRASFRNVVILMF
jgi:hypothetical protein